MSDAGQYIWNGQPSPAQAALLSRPPLPGSAALGLSGEETQQDPSNVPERRLARIIVNPSAGGSADARSSPMPQPQDSQGPLSLEEAYRLYLAKLNANKPQASMSDPAAPFDAFDRIPPGFSAADWSASLAGVDRQNPTQPASSPLTRGLTGSPYGGNPMQSWGDTPDYAGGLLNSIALASLDPQNPDRPAPPPTDDEQDQVKLRELDEKLSSTGDIRDAVALYNARKAIRAKGTFGQA